MNYYRFEKALQAVIEGGMQLSSSQKSRIKEICEGVLLARSSQLSWIARRLPQATNNDIPVVFHGDNEFGGVRLMQYLRDLGWDFIVGQSSKNYHRSYPSRKWQTFGDLRVTKTQSVYLEDVEVTQKYAYGLVNAFAFYKPRFGKRKRKQDIIYCATSLPITPTIRRVGHRRWGVECQFRDMKSSGWNIQNSDLIHPKRREGLLNVLNICYLWATSLGRWLCKTSQRNLVDSKSTRHLSLFRLGWDWLVNQYSTGRNCPALLTLYQ